MASFYYSSFCYPVPRDSSQIVLCSNRSLTGNILDRLNSDDTLKETGAKLGSVVENTTENISQAQRRVERILKGNVTALQQSPDSPEVSGFSLNGF